MPAPYISHICLSVGDKPHDIDADTDHLDDGAETIYADKLWNNGEKIGWAFFGARKGTPRQQQTVRDAIAEWVQCTNVSFIEYPDAKDPSVRVRISFNVVVDEAKRASWAAMGEEATMEMAHTEPTVNIAWVDGGTQEELKEAKAVVLHQIGHVLGLGHEFGRGLTLNKESMQKLLAGKPNQWTKDEVERGIFEVVRKGDVTNFPTVDETSIMKYYMPAFLNEEKIDVAPNPEITDKDKAYMRINYPFIAGKNLKKGAFENAMATLGLGTETVGNMKKNLGKGEIAGVRLDYVKYLVQVHSSAP